MSENKFQEVTRLRKSGNLDEAWEVGCAALRGTPDDQYLKGAVFWICYDFLKEIQKSIKQRPNNDSLIPNASELKRINFFLACIKKLNIPPGGFEYRSLLLIFQNNLEHFPVLVLMLARFSDSLFENEDKKPYVSEQGESPSLMLKFARKLAATWLRDERVRELSVDDLTAFSSSVRDQVSDTKNMIWLDYDQAKCLIKAGRLEQAREFASSVLERKQTESWAWGALAATYKEEDPAAAISLYSKALCHAHDEVFALPALKAIAPLLAAQGFTVEASMCLKRAADCYVKNGWKVRSDLEKLINQPWYNSEVDPDHLQSFIDRRAATAFEFLVGETESRIGVVQNVHRSGKGFHVYFLKDLQISVRKGLYEAKGLPNPGDYVRVTLSKEDHAVVDAKPCSPVEMEGVGWKEGILSIKEQGFGFVEEDTFVPKYLLQDGMDGQSVKVLRICDFDKSKGRYGWKALTIEIV